MRIRHPPTVPFEPSIERVATERVGATCPHKAHRKRRADLYETTSVQKVAPLAVGQPLRVSGADLALTLSHYGSGLLQALSERLRANDASALRQALGRPAVSAKLPHAVANPAKPVLGFPDIAATYGQTAGLAVRGQAAAMLMRLLWQYRTADPAACFDLTAFAKAFGPPGAELVQHLAKLLAQPRPTRPNYRFLGCMVTALAELTSDAQRLPLIDALVRNDALIPRSIPALEHVLQTLPAGTFTGQGLLARQHLFPTFVPLLEACIAKGMQPSDIHVLSTPYNNNPLVRAYCTVKGMHVKGDEAVSTLRRFEESSIQASLGFLADVADTGVRPPRGWLVLDDGGLLLASIAGHTAKLVSWSTEAQALVQAQAARCRSFFDGSRIKGVEQTTRGLTELAQHPVPFAVVAVANAKGKAAEAPMIGWSLARSLVHRLQQEGRLQQTQRLFVVGGGNVGMRAAGELSRCGFKVRIVDIDPAKLKQAKQAGLHRTASRVEQLSTTDVILACTGHHSVDGALLRDWNGVVASGSSAEIEVDDGRQDIFAWPRHRLFNLGRPINFGGDGYENLTKAQIGLTRALLLSALAQETPEGTAGVVPLAAAPQEALLQAWEADPGHALPPISLSAPAAVGLRPDLANVTGRATPDEWEVYLASLPAPVGPCFELSHQRYVHTTFFAEPDGRVRSLEFAHGRSVATPLPAVPFAMHLFVGAGSAREAICFVETSKGVQSYHAHHTADGWAFSPRPRAVGQPMTLVPSFEGSQEYLVTRDAKNLHLIGPGATPCQSWPKQAADTGLIACPRADAPVLEIQVRPAKVFVHSYAGADAKRWCNYQLPKSFCTVTAVLRASDSTQLVLVGRDVEGHTLLAPVDPDRQVTPIVLPVGAVVRHIDFVGVEHYARKDVATVDYTLDGEPDELSLRHRIEVPLAPYGFA